MKTPTVYLLLLLLIALACAEPPNLNCFIDDTKVDAVVACVFQRATKEIAMKIDGARIGLQCPDVACALRKLCSRNRGRIPAPSTNAFYSVEEKAIIRGLFDTCRIQVS
ncbi:uncharacterized protein LOC119180012 [Rhipicephalus microplus]|uniref:uncharacterized protein LOC119180012 n=1 Tax=Rhipicephalus microplus TaxID=6941 RepID=UPI003F6B81B1